MQKIMFNDRYCLTQAVIEGRKTMTRRIKFDNEFQKMIDDSDSYYYDDGYLVFATQDVDIHHVKTRYKLGEIVAVAQSYEAAGFDPEYCIEGGLHAKKHAGWRNKMFVGAKYMPHQIRITGIRCEPLRGIPDEDCMKEGVVEVLDAFGKPSGYYTALEGTTLSAVRMYSNTPREAFAVLIDKVSGRGTWKSNPWVVVYEFELVK